MNPRNLIFPAVLLGAVAGSVATYFTTRKILDEQYQKSLEAEIASTKKYYQRLHKGDAFSTPEKTMQQLRKEHEEIPPKTVEEEAAEAHLKYLRGGVTVVMDEERDHGIDIDPSEEERNPFEPYVVTQEEYFQDPLGLSHSALIYYAGDHVLADETEREIPNVDAVVGEDNLERFGHGSGDSRIVYIFNERMKRAFEVSINDGNYAEQVLGLEHSDGGYQPNRYSDRPPKFKADRVR